MPIEPPADRDAFHIANFMELTLLTSGDARLSLAEVRDHFMSGDKPPEEVFDDAMSEIADRAARLGQHYPYRRDGDSVVLRDCDGRFLYGALVLMAVEGSRLRRDKDYQWSDPVFDVIVRETVVAALGAGAVAVCFGFPPRGDRPSKFDDAVEWVSRLIGVGLRSNEADPEEADGGVDVIGWNRFPDHEVGFPLILVQNTVQEKFVKKARDVVPQNWREWIRIKANPLVGFAVPFAMPPSDRWWEKSSSNVTFMWDRRRIVWQLRNANLADIAEWDDVRRFVEIECAAIEEDAEVVVRVERRRKTRKGAPLIPRGAEPASDGD